MFTYLHVATLPLLVDAQGGLGFLLIQEGVDHAEIVAQAWNGAGFLGGVVGEEEKSRVRRI